MNVTECWPYVMSCECYDYLNVMLFSLATSAHTKGANYIYIFFQIFSYGKNRFVCQRGHGPIPSNTPLDIE